jgi:hypothetical protein
LIEWHIKSTTKALQGLYEYDAVSRLRDTRRRARARHSQLHQARQTRRLADGVVVGRIMKDSGNGHGYHFGRLEVDFVTRPSFVTTATALLVITASSSRKNPNSATLSDTKTPRSVMDLRVFRRPANTRAAQPV